MVIYLDQNKWIELARIENSPPRDSQARSALQEIRAALESGCVFPLSGLHIIEFSRISNPTRRARLGRVMWKYSRGLTCAPLKAIVTNELENAFLRFGYKLTPRPFSYISSGIAHAYGEEYECTEFQRMFADEIDEAMLCGSEELNIEPLSYASVQYRQNFLTHLKELQKKKGQLPRSKWDNWLYAIAMVDILEPINEVIRFHHLTDVDFFEWGESRLKEFMDLLSTRRLDIHLHRQVLKNDQYSPKETDLEGWAGLGAAMCSADVVVCEKHFASLAQKGRCKTRARIETRLQNIFPSLRR